MRKPDLSGGTNTSANSLSDAGARAARSNKTGRHVVVFRRDAVEEGIKTLEAAGLKVVVSPASSTDVLREDDAPDADVIVFPRLGVAVVAGDPDQVSQLTNVASDSASPILTVRPEKVRFVSPEGGYGLQNHVNSGLNSVAISADYLKGYRGAIVNLVNDLTQYVPPAPITNGFKEAAASDESKMTWGLQATRADKTKFSGRGIRIAILDTGLDFDVTANGKITHHPDFEGRTIVAETFVSGTKTAKDGHGHGTHCVGTACGPLKPGAPPRYGVAHDAEIYVGKVMSDIGSGADGWIMAGIEWALSHNCQVISMSLGSAMMPGDPFDIEYENIARRALDQGAIIVAAAGNGSGRPDEVMPVDGPANCPSIMAVAAVDSHLQLPSFTNGGINPNGGEVDIAAPGVGVYSSYLRPTGYARKSGTSMATPHVAGIAALYAEANPGVTGRALWNLIVKNASKLQHTPQDVGAGLVQAP